MKVLVVESEDWLRGLLVPWVLEAGFEVLTCPGPEGPDFDCAGATKYGCPLAESADLIVLDLELESDLLVCGVAAWELLHYYRSLDRPVVVLWGIDDPMRPLPGDRIAVLRRPPDRDAVVEAIRVLLLTKQLHPSAEPETVPDVLVAGTGAASRRPVEASESSGVLANPTTRHSRNVTIRAIHGGSGRHASKREDRRFGAVIFGRDGTAAPDRPAELQMCRLMAGLRVSGSHQGSSGWSVKRRVDLEGPLNARLCY